MIGELEDGVPTYFGSFRRCNYPRLTSPGETQVVFECGRYASFNAIPSLWWRITTVSVGVGAGLSLLIGVTATSACCLSNVVHKTSARVMGSIQALAVLALTLFCKFPEPVVGSLWLTKCSTKKVVEEESGSLWVLGSHVVPLNELQRSGFSAQSENVSGRQLVILVIGYASQQYYDETGEINTVSRVQRPIMPYEAKQKYKRRTNKLGDVSALSILSLSIPEEFLIIDLPGEEEN
ncbi:unnamed protein product [Darwinula stevensoni]|uniref:Uncharacterized protein n=1 Tax=Darwinula stevensoni TaxID=69355 RepID=A0A7R8X5F6_9CRUS|nr:unnamed protein product [Darwinula stevensoni]CAG0880871.1 unnamed protein product [Darwinula stevensoni]